MDDIYRITLFIFTGLTLLTTLFIFVRHRPPSWLDSIPAILCVIFVALSMGYNVVIKWKDAEITINELKREVQLAKSEAAAAQKVAEKSEGKAELANESLKDLLALYRPVFSTGQGGKVLFQGVAVDPQKWIIARDAAIENGLVREEDLPKEASIPTDSSGSVKGLIDPQSGLPVWSGLEADPQLGDINREEVEKLMERLRNSAEIANQPQ